MSTPSEPSSSEPSEDRNSSLFDPPAGGDPNLVPGDSEGTVEFTLKLSPEQAEALRELAAHLSLPPATVAARAIEVVCGEVKTVPRNKLSTKSVIEEYQARLDLMHSLK